MSPIKELGSPELTELDPRGDVVFVVGSRSAAAENTPARRFRLCSRTMARASPVFDRMLHGNFAESKPAAAAAVGSAGPPADWVVDLPDDDAAAYDLFASIAHGSFRRVPRGLGVGRLYDLTVLTHYYDATPMLTPWLQGWMVGIGETPDGGDEGMLMLKLLWISWELGHKQLFETTARRMVMECRGIFLGDESGIEGLNMPPDVIASIRTQTIQAIMDVFRDLAEKLVIIDEGPRWCRHASYMGPHRCESMILGSMTFCLTRAGLWPVPDAADVDESVVGLYSSLMNLVIHDIGRPGEKNGVDHSECNPRGFLMGRIKDILADVQNPVT
ncbi:nuclear pore protein-like protein, partial [Colletotrichum sojae]